MWEGQVFGNSDNKGWDTVKKTPAPKGNSVCLFSENSGLHFCSLRSHFSTKHLGGFPLLCLHYCVVSVPRGVFCTQGCLLVNTWDIRIQAFLTGQVRGKPLTLSLRVTEFHCPWWLIWNSALVLKGSRHRLKDETAQVLVQVSMNDHQDPNKKISVFKVCA